MFMKKLLLAWKEPDKKKWIVVGKLWYKDNKYYFGYTEGVQEAMNSNNFVLFGQMQHIDKMYVSEELFPIFQNRLFQKKRPEYQDYLNWLGYNREISPLEELARTHGIRATDSLQLFEIPVPIDGKYLVYFFSHGIRHLPQCYQDRIKHLKEGEKLYLMKDVQNKVDKYALVLRTDDPVEIVGYCPRFYVTDFNKLLELNTPEKVDVSIVKINLDAPKQLQLLCKFETFWPDGFQPFDKDEYTLIVEGYDG